MTATVVRLPRATRTAADADMDLPPCATTWGGGCYGAEHRCWTWTGWPHICRCLHCATAGGAR